MDDRHLLARCIIGNIVGSAGTTSNAATASAGDSTRETRKARELREGMADAVIARAKKERALEVLMLIKSWVDM